MIIDKPPLPDDPTPEDAPPAYDFPATYGPPVPEKGGEPSSAAPSPLPAASSSTSLGSPTGPPPKKAGSKGKARWFSFGQSRTAKEVKSTVMGLLRDVVRVPDAAAASVLQNCADVCEEHGLAFSALLQERAIEGHSALYWAIIKRPRPASTPAATPAPDSKGEPEKEREDGLELVHAMLALAAPLAPAAVSEIRLACLQASDQALFHALRATPAFAPLSGTDAILLGADRPPDDVAVRELPGNQGEFAAVFCVPHFQKRMRVSKQVRLEFIARGRMWCLAFLDSPGTRQYAKGTWLVSLSLMEHSPSTFVDSRLLIPAPAALSSSSSLPPSLSPSLSPCPSSAPSPAPDASPPPRAPPGAFPALSALVCADARSKAPPAIELRLKTGAAPLWPAPAPDGGCAELCVPLGKSALGNSLQFDGCTFIAEDGSLTARLEARLAKPDSECVIC